MSGFAFRAILVCYLFFCTIAAWADDFSFFASRREALMKKIEGAIAVLQGAPDSPSLKAFRQDNNFYYLTGLEVPNALLLLDAARHHTILFLPPRDEDKERWEGPGLFAGPEVRTRTGIDEVLELARFTEELEKRKNSLSVVYTPFARPETEVPGHSRTLEHGSTYPNEFRGSHVGRQEALVKSLMTKLGDVSIRDLSPVLDAMRRVKDAQEIERLRIAGRISALAMKEAMRSLRPGMYEYQAAAVAEFVFLWRGAQGTAFSSIVGSGPNSCFPHYNANRRRIEAGDIVVMDIGADYAYYQSDITRSFPASGKFSKEQAEVYRAVLGAYKAVLEKVRPGSTLKLLNDTASKVLENAGYGSYVKHGVCHYVGMSVHDVGEAEPFEAGVVIALEPGVYLPEKNLGIRIEDTVLVTRDGYEILTGDAPKEIEEIEKLMLEAGFAKSIAH